ncbi:hypothetical protein B7463_g11950, partial [Scytalidium lignicola]
MAFGSVNPPGQTFLLWHRFHMPTKHGARDAVAVEPKVADKLLSAYTFLVEHIVLFAWGITVFSLLYIVVKIYERSDPSIQFHVEIYKKKSSPYAAFTTVVQYPWRKESKLRPWVLAGWVLLWVIIALGFVIAKYTVSIIFAPYIKLDNAAPVNPSTIFVPHLDPTNNEALYGVYSISVPLAFRAAGSVDNLDKDDDDNKAPPVSIDQPELLDVRSDGQQVIRLGYQYNVTGLDLGLQHYPDLTLNVEGACTTEYGWLNSTSNSDPNAPVEVYLPFNDVNQAQQVSLFDGGPPMAYFFTGPSTSSTNATWAAIISSANRWTFEPSDDPWYLTESVPSDLNPPAPYIVRTARPALSCWQNDVWSYQGHTSSVNGLNTTSLSGLNLSWGLQNILASRLGLPMIYRLGSYLRASSLQSSYSSLSNIFNASSSSIHNDLQRLVSASYIATVNALTDTTLFVNTVDVPNDLDVGGYANNGTGDFVLFTQDAVALSIRTLIIIPVITVSLWLLFFLLMTVPIPGRIVRDRLKPSKRKGHDHTSEKTRVEAEVAQKQDDIEKADNGGTPNDLETIHTTKPAEPTGNSKTEPQVEIKEVIKNPPKKPKDKEEEEAKGEDEISEIVNDAASAYSLGGSVANSSNIAHELVEGLND